MYRNILWKIKYVNWIVLCVLCCTYIMLFMIYIYLFQIIKMFLPERLLKTELRRHNCYREYLHYVKSLDKLDKCILRTNFLVECRNSDIIPKFLHFRIPKNGCLDDQTVHNFQRSLLHKEIGKAILQNKLCESRLCESRQQLKSVLPRKCLPSIVELGRPW